MLVFAHVGITWGAGLAINKVWKYRRSRLLTGSREISDTGEEKGIPKPDTRLGLGLTSLIFLAVGSLLPDIIDKPIGHFLFAQTFGHNGRIFSHTLLFFLLCLAIGLYFYLGRKKTGGLYLAFGVFTHLILDFMWATPQTLFWPLLGWSFPVSLETNWTDWVADMFRGVENNPATYIPEIIGFLVVVYVIPVLVKDRWEIRNTKFRIQNNLRSRKGPG